MADWDVHGESGSQQVRRIEARFRRLTFADNYVFGKVLERDLEACRELLEAVLGIEIDHVELAERERALDPARDSKSVRLDVYAKDSEGRAFDVEMQRSNAIDLTRRARYYQAAMDTEQLGRGNDYNFLTDSYVIFFCTFDPFGRGRKQYTYSRMCEEDGEIEPWDGTRHVYLNATGTVGKVSDELQDVLDYLVGDNDCDSQLVRRLDEGVREVLSSPEELRGYIMYQWNLDDERRVGRAEGLAEGRAEGLAEGRAEGLAEGRTEGLAEGRAEGLSKGRAEGLSKGRAEGLSKGRTEERDRLSRLYEELEKSGRADEFVKALRDSQELEELYKEFGIVDSE